MHGTPAHLEDSRVLHGSVTQHNVLALCCDKMQPVLFFAGAVVYFRPFILNGLFNSQQVERVAHHFGVNRP